ncbi:MAG: NfeD family protein [Verrucomicrobiota bacterium]
MELIVGLIICGVCLIIVEIFLPGMIAGVCGVVCLIIATILGYKEYGPSVGTVILVGEIIFGFAFFFLWAKYFPKTSFGKKFILPNQPKTASPNKTEILEGLTGITLTPLHPSGMAQINGKRCDVITEGSLIDKDIDVKVIKVEGSRIIVRPV